MIATHAKQRDKKLRSSGVGGVGVHGTLWMVFASAILAGVLALVALQG